eukprot:TRINITY_DN18197_c0_g1_i1.p1 TRINITY_DN18197_c0_g1~~TRINITY_DN18197_c0_g1_i1.p1  ORF type:complete len:276 (+),score=70.78 TRINITY_DN18197_c0_g1_i1:50-829(+)
MRVQFSLLVLLLIIVLAEGKKKRATAYPGIVKHLQCSVCREGVANIFKEVAYWRPKVSKFTEDDIQTRLEQSCNPRRREGWWIRYFDIEKKDDRNLEVVDFGKATKVNKKGQSIADTCSTVLLGDIDLTAQLYADKKKIGELVHYICVKGGDSGDPGPCSKKTKIPKISAKLLKDLSSETPVEAPRKEMEAEEQLVGMETNGMPEGAFQMYGRDDVDEMAIDELMKEGDLDEDEARKMLQEMKDSGLLDLQHIPPADEL